MNDYKLLRHIKRKKEINYTYAKNKEQLDCLCADGRLLYEIHENKDATCRITPKGENYIYEETKMFVHWLIPTCVSFISLAISVIALLL